MEAGDLDAGLGNAECRGLCGVMWGNVGDHVVLQAARSIVIQIPLDYAEYRII